MQEEKVVTLEQRPIMLSGSDGSIQSTVQEQIEAIRRREKEGSYGSCPNQVHGWSD